MRIVRAASVFLAVCLSLEASPARKHSRYIFVLPEGYVGWVQVIFMDPNAKPLAMKDGGYVIDVPESGISRTSDMRVHDSSPKAINEFYYRSASSSATEGLGPIPSDYILPGDSQGGFGIKDTGGKGAGYSWFVFIGAPVQRAKEPLADWNKVVDEWYKAHGNRRVLWSGQYPYTYPSPGRMKGASSAQ